MKDHKVLCISKYFKRYFTCAFVGPTALRIIAMIDIFKVQFVARQNLELKEVRNVHGDREDRHGQDSELHVKPLRSPFSQIQLVNISHYIEPKSMFKSLKFYVVLMHFFIN